MGIKSIKLTKKKVVLLLLLILVVAFFAVPAIRAMIGEHEAKKYGGHGFEYMNGYSSTDFTGYHVYDGEKLATLDHEASLRIEKEKDMPVLDGAEACYPLYCAVAKAVYKDIDKIELAAKKEEEDWHKAYMETDIDDERYDEIEKAEKPWYWSNGKIVQFTNTIEGYSALAEGKVDIFVGGRPSDSQIAEAKEEGVEIESTPIGQEAFVFFVEEDNPVDGITSDQARAIYHGDITNWKELGGKDQKIVAFQRPEDSGSQVTMERFMGDVSLKEPDTYETVDAMAGVIENVKQYSNEAGAIGYTFRYFLTGLQQEKDVKILEIDGVFPTEATISDGTYPIIGQVVCSTRAGNKDPNVKKVVDFFLSKDGQELVEKSGYGKLKQ